MTANATIKTAAAPTLVYPANGDTALSKSLTFRWHPQAADSFYIIQVDSSASFNSTLLQTDSTTDTTKAITLTLDSTIYRWHVKGANHGGASAYSAAWTAKTAASSGGNGGLVGGLATGTFAGAVFALYAFRKKIFRGGAFRG